VFNPLQTTTERFIVDAPYSINGDFNVLMDNAKILLLLHGIGFKNQTSCVYIKQKGTYREKTLYQ